MSRSPSRLVRARPSSLRTQARTRSIRTAWTTSRSRRRLLRLTRPTVVIASIALSGCVSVTLPPVLPSPTGGGRSVFGSHGRDTDLQRRPHLSSGTDASTDSDPRPADACGIRVRDATARTHAQGHAAAAAVGAGGGRPHVHPPVAHGRDEHPHRRRGTEHRGRRGGPRVPDQVVPRRRPRPIGAGKGAVHLRLPESHRTR